MGKPVAHLQRVGLLQLGWSSLGEGAPVRYALGPTETSPGGWRKSGVATRACDE